MDHDPYWERTRYNYNIKRDSLHVAGQAGKGSAAVLWGSLAGVIAVFAPLMLPSPVRIAAMIIWWGLLGILLMCFLVALARRKR